VDFRYVRLSDGSARTDDGASVASKVADLFCDRGMATVLTRGAVPETQWREALRGMCDEARTDGVAAEQLIVEVKEALGILCDTCAVPYGPARRELTSRVVTLCIEEYYASAASP
jgi:hypothetical protein